MAMEYEWRDPVHPDDFVHYDDARLRRAFLVDRLFTPDTLRLVYTYYDRMIVGGAMPVSGPVELEPIEPLMRAKTFLERRELGVINVGGSGEVEVDGTRHALEKCDALYVGRGAERVRFFSRDAAHPARFYINSAPAHAAYPTVRVPFDQAETVALGDQTHANRRSLHKLLVDGRIQTCQLQMGITALAPGGVWNTMPPHIHRRRMEAYFYFDLDENERLCHIMGTASHPRPIWVANEQAVVSPPWSMHCGVGTANYRFIWSMAGENLDYGDMDFIQPARLGGER
ncbi:MAG: 4-deoxy-L-threo-5-hexosulose-uronate ketol-isomerase [Gammaproteobacteria bacterium]|nr:MAG: 4-deoxy-L-threo-5-hexosulose-uronate ketol-isomerase [Gammaproteobacteria bacterium]